MGLTGILNIVASIRGQSLGNDEESVGESLDTELGLALHCAGEGIALQASGTGHVERTTTRYHALVDDHVVDTSEAVSDGVGNLGDGVLVRSLDHESHGFGVLDLLNEGELLLTEGLLVDEAGPAENIGSEILYTVLGNTTTDQLKTLHVPALRATQSQNAVLGEDVEGKRVDTLLVDDHKVLLSVSTADFLLQLDDLLEFGIDEAALALDELVSLVRAGVEEARVDFSLLVLKPNVHGQDVAVLEVLGHVGVSCAVVKGETADELCVRCRAVLHLHDLHHVKIGLGWGLVDGQNGIDDIRSELVRECCVELSGERSPRHVEKELTVDLLGELEVIQELRET